jgi:hypothetical protein
MKKLSEQEYIDQFNKVCDIMMDGKSRRFALNHVGMTPQKFRSLYTKHNDLHAKFDMANKELAQWCSDELLKLYETADDHRSVRDKVDLLKHLMAVLDRDRFGNHKNVNKTVTTNPIDDFRQQLINSKKGS